MLLRRWIARTLWSALLCLLAWSGGLLWFTGHIPAAPPSALPAAPAIVVLTGGSGRLERGLELLAEGKAAALFVSGAGKKVALHDIVLRAPPPAREVIARLPAGAVALGREAENTIGNAEETARWIRENRFGAILLVTANYHMPRAVAEFREALPEVTIHPAPVFPEDFHPARWWLRGQDRKLVLSEYHKYLAGKLRHWLLSVLPAS